MTSSPLRRSTRPRHSTVQYAKDSYSDMINDAFDVASRVDAEGSDDAAETDQDDSDAFVADADTPGHDKDDLEHDSGASEHQEGNDADDVSGDEADESDDDDDGADEKTPSIKQEPGTSTRRKAPAANGSRGQPTRGLRYDESRSSKLGTRNGLFGPDPADQEPAFQAAYKWKYDLCIPTRKPDRAGFGGFNQGFYRTKVQRQHEMDTSWTYYDTAAGPDQPSGQDRIKIRQVFASLSQDEAVAYKATTGEEAASIVAGPLASQTLQSLLPNEAIHLDTAFRPVTTSQHTAPQEVQRHGWYINVGQRVQCLDWATNQSGPCQVLAVSTMPSNFGRGESQFAPRPGKSAIHLWTFKADSVGRIDSGVRPRLQLSIYSDWGQVRSFKWCPVPRSDHAQLPVLHLGLLAGVWTDGSVRLLDVRIDDIEAPTQLRRCTRAAFAAKPPRGVFTSVAWLSATGLVAGCSDGTISVFDIPASLMSHSEFAAPMMQVSVQPAYILSVTTCYPSRPQIVCTASMSGVISMTDLLEVTPRSAYSSTHTIPSGRSRIGKSSLAWYDFGQAIITTDDNCGVLTIPLRRFFATTGAGILPSNCIVHAVSPVHPFVAMGTAGGEAAFTDPIKRLVNSKAKIWIQTWFAHEFRPDFIPDTTTLHDDRNPTASGDEDDIEMVDESTKPQAADPSSLQTRAGKARAGKVRFLEGFKVENSQLDRAKRARAKDQVPITLTLYEPETAITAMAWNPNVHVGGWCAAGMASGLLRVEDVAKG